MSLLRVLTSWESRQPYWGMSSPLPTHTEAPMVFTLPGRSWVGLKYRNYTGLQAPHSQILDHCTERMWRSSGRKAANVHSEPFRGWADGAGPVLDLCCPGGQGREGGSPVTPHPSSDSHTPPQEPGHRYRAPLMGASSSQNVVPAGLPDIPRVSPPCRVWPGN